MEDLLLQSLTHDDINKLDFNITDNNIIELMKKIINSTGFHIFKIIININNFQNHILKIYNNQINLYESLLSSELVESILEKDYLLLIDFLNISDDEIYNARNSIYFNNCVRTDEKILIHILQKDKYKKFLYKYYPIVRLTIIIYKIIRTFINKNNDNKTYDFDISNYQKK